MYREGNNIKQNVQMQFHDCLKTLLKFDSKKHVFLSTPLNMIPKLSLNLAM